MNPEDKQKPEDKQNDDDRIPGNIFGPEKLREYTWMIRPRHRRRPGGPTLWRVKMADLLPPPPPPKRKRKPCGPLPPA
ncbi:MAG: hypothetical protein NT154_39320 [Verrucomicrobia bacterium]|nr:hypothetical protein [Verrucomicrobiota bacterium]